MSDRLFAGAWLLVSALVAWATGQIEVTYAYEPIGPRAFPWLLCAGMAACAAWMIWKPDPEPSWPRGVLGAKSTVLLAAMVAYAFAFEPLGFPLATLATTVAVGRVFGGGWWQSGVAGVGFGLGLYYTFDHLLEVTLPLGTLWS